VNLCHFCDFCHPKNPYEKYTPPYGKARGDPILMEGTVYRQRNIPKAYFKYAYYPKVGLSIYSYPCAVVLFGCLLLSSAYKTQYIPVIFTVTNRSGILQMPTFDLNEFCLTFD
jgi:hypothetical protein